MAGRVLAEGKVYSQAGGIRQTVKSGVAGHSHDGDPLWRAFRRRMAEHEALADGVLVREELTGQRRVDHRNERGIFGIGINKLTAALQRYAEGMGVSRTDTVTIGMWIIPRLRQC